jgi:hypothetical protein
MEPETAIERQTMSIEEAARLLGIGRNNPTSPRETVRSQLSKIGKRILVLKEALKRMLEGSL